MKGTREEYIKKLTPHIEEIYGIHIESLNERYKEWEKRAKEIRAELKVAIRRRDSLIHNISRATVDDLKSYHYLFFDCEGQVIKEKTNNETSNV